MSSLTARRALLLAALGFGRLAWPHRRPPAVSALRRWLDSWTGVGAVVAGMTAQGHDVELRQFPHGWRANFYPTGTAHSIVTGSAWQPTPWAAVQGAAWRALGEPPPAGTTPAVRDAFGA